MADERLARFFLHGYDFFTFAKSCLNHQGLQSNFDTSDRRHPAGHVYVQI